VKPSASIHGKKNGENEPILGSQFSAIFGGKNRRFSQSPS
jgi:hypothetical protein